jgi:hypothetical protein
MSSGSAFNTVAKSGSGSTSQNAIQNINNQMPASHGRPIARSYINTVVPTSSAAIHSNQLPYSHQMACLVLHRILVHDLVNWLAS